MYVIGQQFQGKFYGIVLQSSFMFYPFPLHYICSLFRSRAPTNWGSRLEFLVQFAIQLLCKSPVVQDGSDLSTLFFISFFFIIILFCRSIHMGIKFSELFSSDLLQLLPHSSM